MSTTYNIIVCSSVVPDPLQTLEPVKSANGDLGLKNELMLPHILDPFGSHALYEAANLIKKYPGSKIWLIISGPKAKLQQVMMSVAQKVPFELIAIDTTSSGFTDSYEAAAMVNDAINSIPGLDKNNLLIFGGWESASRGSGTTLQIIGELQGIMDQFQGVDSFAVNEDGSFTVLERIEGGKHLQSTTNASSVLIGWATGDLGEPPNNPQLGMVNMRVIMPALQKAKLTKYDNQTLKIDKVELPSKRKETRVVTDVPVSEMVTEIVEWLKRD